jgi:hypothetical protein
MGCYGAPRLNPNELFFESRAERSSQKIIWVLLQREALYRGGKGSFIFLEIPYGIIE